MATPGRDDGIPELDHYRVDMGGTAVLLDAVNAVVVARCIDNDVKLARVVDLYGAGTDIQVSKIECVSYITPESAALARAWRRAFLERVDEVDPDGEDKRDGDASW